MKTKKKQTDYGTGKPAIIVREIPGPVKAREEGGTDIVKLRRLVARLEIVGPVVAPGIAVSLLGLSRQYVWQLMRDGRLQTQAVQGAELVSLRSLLRFAELREERRQKRAERLMQQAKQAVDLAASPYQYN